MTTPPENDPSFDPFRYGRPEPGSPAAAAFPHLFDNPPSNYGGQPTPPPAHPGQPVPPGYPGQPPTYAGEPPPPRSPYSAASGHSPRPTPTAPPQWPSGPTSYGYPPPSGWAPPPAGDNGRAVAGFVLGLVALLLFWLTVLDLPLVVLGIIFSALGLKAARRGGAHGGLAWAGLILAIVAAVAATVFTVVVVQRINACTDSYGSSTSQYDQCVRFQRSP